MLAGALAICAVLAPQWLVWLIPGLVVFVSIGWLSSNARAENVRHRNSEEVVQLCLALAAQLKAGELPSAALIRVAADAPMLRPVTATQAIGGDVPAAIEMLSARPGCSGLASLARSWQLCQVTGASIAEAASRVAEGLRSQAAAERLVSAELSSPRATGRLLALLPLMGIGLGFSTGGDPVAFLIGSLIGRICLGGAVCLVCAGLIWTTLLGRLSRDE